MEALTEQERTALRALGRADFETLLYALVEEMTYGHVLWREIAMAIMETDAYGSLSDTIARAVLQRAARYKEYAKLRASKSLEREEELC